MIIWLYFCPFYSWFMFTPIQTTAGAILLHLATTILLFDTGAILGASGFLRRLLLNPRKEVTTNSSTTWFFAGTALASAFLVKLLPSVVPKYPNVEWEPSTVLQAVLGGLLTGWGTKVSVPGCFSLLNPSLTHLECSTVVVARLDICFVALDVLVLDPSLQQPYSFP